MIRPSSERGDVVAYDFRRPSRISPDRQRNLEASHEQMAQALQRWISGRLRLPFEVHLESVGQETYADFVDSLADPGSTFLYEVESRRELQIAVHLEPPIAFLLVERLLGGSTVGPPLERPMTGLEAVIMRVVTDRVVKEVRDVWSEHLDLDFSFVRSETARELIEMAGRDDDVLLTQFRAEVGEVKSIIQFALPFGVLESFVNVEVGRGRQPERSGPERAEEVGRIERTVRSAAVEVSARLGHCRMSIEDLSRLEAGDMLPMELLVEEPVEVLVSGTPRFVGRQGRLGPHLGIEIIEAIN